jgi:hypothetical protein
MENTRRLALLYVASRFMAVRIDYCGKRQASSNKRSMSGQASSFKPQASSFKPQAARSRTAEPG